MRSRFVSLRRDDARDQKEEVAEVEEEMEELGGQFEGGQTVVGKPASQRACPSPVSAGAAVAG